ncbi:MAG: hypothetical protein A2075_03820 [Geobacteraceae bacterium GWC2_58_44]|nr:MAG: hypothetical protein A2075_03820 [Geobacteraceae bacterium GWC2_58_44]HBG07523.1 hypothetical protein [Geobacter sp.]
MKLRRSTIYLGMTSGLMLTLAGLLLHASGQRRAAEPGFARKAALVRQVELTDLCLFTEASYTRNPSMTDLSTPFQDSPLSLDHFPSGGLIGPPTHLTRNQRD